MLNTEMLFRMRSFLDEKTADFYVDATELYVALSLARIEVAKIIADVWHERQQNASVPIPRAIQFLTTVETKVLSSGDIDTSVAGNPLQIVYVQWNPSGVWVQATTPYAVEIGWDVKSGMIKQNRLLNDGLFFSNMNGVITINPVSTDNSSEMRVAYIDTPVDITASVQPELRDVAHDCIIERALWLILKDRESEQANIHLQMYGVLLKGLIL